MGFMKKNIIMYSIVTVICFANDIRAMDTKINSNSQEVQYFIKENSTAKKEIMEYLQKTHVVEVQESFEKMMVKRGLSQRADLYLAFSQVYNAAQENDVIAFESHLSRFLMQSVCI